MTETPNDFFNALPGIETPVSEALERLSAMWEAPADSSSSKPPSEFRASRMNLILHVGLDASPKEAQLMFRSVIDFSRRYPCRVLALCPHSGEGGEHEMACKIFSECYIGVSGKDMSCCEAIILGYPMSDRRFLENQVSIFLESDLPTYYWPYKFDSPGRLSDYQAFFKESQRLVFDSGSESFAPDQIELPEPEKLHDLAYSRLLSARQCVGQFLSAFPPEEIVDSLEQVSIASCFEMQAESRVLLQWLKSALSRCFQYAESDNQVMFDCEVLEVEKECPRVAFLYGNDNTLECVLDFESGCAQIEARIGDEVHSMTAAIRLLDCQEALAEALFFD